ncbi:histidine--tRNA ligase [Vallitaleaceae bacterium 9-2]
MNIKAPRGTNDFYGDYMDQLLDLEHQMRCLCDDYGFSEIRTPIFERLELFQRGVGETTDIVQKEMYTFFDKSKEQREFALKPEGTAGVVRAYLERKLYADVQPSKFYYISPNFRYEKPQAGRFRQFHQFGVELFGAEDPSADAEIISLGYQMLKRLNIPSVKLHINSLGNQVSRKRYNGLLMDFLEAHKNELCPTCQERMYKNPLRVLDCKNETCQTIMQEAPLMIHHLDDADREHFEGVQALLDSMGIAYEVDPWIVRGLDYYSRTVFEFISEDIGSQATVCGGGRYDYLIEEMGGAPTPAIGFGAGIERLLLTIANTQGKPEPKEKIDLYLGYMGDAAKNKAMALTYQLREQHIRCATDLLGKSVRAQMKYANKINAKYSLIIGEDEIASNTVSLKNMKNGEQVDISMEEIASYIHSQQGGK